MVTTEQHEDAIQEFIDKYQDGPDAVRVILKVNFSNFIPYACQVVPDYLGTAGILLSLKPDLRGDIIVMGGDLIVEGDFLHHMADTHRSRDAASNQINYSHNTHLYSYSSRVPRKNRRR